MQMKKETKTKLLTIRFSESEINLIRTKSYLGKKGNLSKLIRKILLNIPEKKGDKILIKNDGYSITKNGGIL